MDYTLQYSPARGLYWSTITETDSQILLISHNHTYGCWKQFEIPNKQFKVEIWSHFKCAYYMYAIIRYKDKLLLDFNPQKLFVLNHRELLKFYISTTMGHDQAWQTIFDKIIEVYNYRDLYYQHREPQISQYLQTLLNIAMAQDIDVWYSWSINWIPAKWTDNIHIFSLFSDNLYLLLVEAEKDETFSKQYETDIMNLCNTFLSLLKSMFGTLNYYKKEEGKITIEDSIVKTFDKIHNYFESKGDSAIFLSALIKNNE